MHLVQYHTEYLLLSFFRSQGVSVVSHLEPGFLWWSGRQHDCYNLVLFHTRGADTVISQNSSMVSSSLILLLPSGVTTHPQQEQVNKSHPLCLISCSVLSILLFILNRPISEYFLVRDTSLIPNILWFEYTVTRSEAR